MKLSFETIIEKFNELNVKIRYAIFGIVFAVILCADYFFVVGFQQSFIQHNKEESEKVKQDIDRVKFDEQRVKQITKGVEDSRSQLAAMNKKIRSSEEESVILQEISKTASGVGFVIDKLMPQRQAEETLITSPEGKFYTLPIVIQTHSGYHVFGRFLNHLENSNLSFSLKDMRIETNEKQPGSLVITATLKITLVDRSGVKEDKKP